MRLHGTQIVPKTRRLQQQQGRRHTRIFQLANYILICPSKMVEFPDQLILTTKLISANSNNNNNSPFFPTAAAFFPSPLPLALFNNFSNKDDREESETISTNSTPPITDILKAGALFLLVLWTILANLLVFIVLYKNPRLQTVPNLLVGNLALSDFCLALIVLPLSSIYACAGEWLFNDTLCQIFVSADILCSTASIWNLSIVGLDRYWAITSPVAYLNKRNKRTACLMIVSVWSFSALISLAPLLGWKQVAEHGNMVKINGTWQCTFLDLPSYTIYSATGSFFIPTLLMFFVYFKIYQAFAKHRARQIYRQKVIRRHIESTILHEISHILPTSDEFAKDVEEDEEDEEANRQTPPDENREIRPESVSLPMWPPSQKNDSGTMMIPIQHATIYEEDEEEEENEESSDSFEKNETPEKSNKSGRCTLGKKIMRTKTVEIERNGGGGNGETLKWAVDNKNGGGKEGGGNGGANGQGSPGGTKVTFKRGVGEKEDGEEQQQPMRQTKLLLNSKKQWKSFGYVEQNIGKQNGESKNEMQGKKKSGKDEKIRRDSEIPADTCHSKSDARLAHPPGAMPTYEKVRRHKKRKELNIRKSLQTKPRAISAAKERRGVRVLGIILGCFTLCWTPFFIMYVVVQFCTDCSVNPHIEMFITWLGYSNSAMNPIIYTVFNRDYQIALKRLFMGRAALAGGGIRSTLQRPMIGFSR